MYAIFVTVNVKPDKRQEFLGAIEDDATCSERDEPGCVRFNVLQDQNNENRYYFYEVYRDEDAFQKHQTYPHYARWRAAAAQVLDGPAERLVTSVAFPRPDGPYWKK